MNFSIPRYFYILRSLSCAQTKSITAVYAEKVSIAFRDHALQLTNDIFNILNESLLNATHIKCIINLKRNVMCQIDRYFLQFFIP